MKKWVGFFLGGYLLVSLSVAEAAPEPSLFFTADDVQKIEDLASKQSYSAAETGDVHLGAVFYYGPENWVLWLQGKRWTPETEQSDLHIVDVKPDAVRLTITSTAGAVAEDVTLKPYQTYRFSTGEVVEGPPGAAPEASR